MNRVLVIGAGGHGQVVADILRCMARETGEVKVVGFLDDDPQLWGQFLLGISVLGPMREVRTVPHDGVIVAIGDNPTRARVSRALIDSGEQLATAVHPRAVIGTDVRVGSGSMICAGVVVNVAAEIGEGVILNTGSTVDHHCLVESYAHVAPGAHLGGEVRIGEKSLIGIGATILPRCKVGNCAVVGGGAVVIGDVPAKTKVVGVPARRIGGPPV